MKTKITFLILSIFTLTLFSQTKIDNNLSEFWNGSSWENNSKTEYQYNVNNQLSISTSLVWNSSWVNSYKEIYAYDANDNIMQINNQEWNEGTNQWVNIYKQTRTLNGNNNPTQFLDYDWVNSQWVNSYKTAISYVSANKINESISSFWDGSQWIVEEKATYNYNANNKFNNIIYEYFDGSQWSLSGRDTYSYFTNGKISETLYQDWTGSQWEDVEKSEYQLDSNFNRLSTIYYDLFSGTDPYGKDEYTYDTSILMSTIIHPFNDIILYDLGFENNPFINKVLGETQSIYNNGIWEQNERKTYHYTNTASLSDNSINVSIHPNPTSDIVTINLDNLFNIKQVNIYDTLGKKVFTTTKNQLNIQTLENGIYFLELETTSGNIAKKTIIKK